MLFKVSYIALANTALAAAAKPVWQPTVGAKWQIMIWNNISISSTTPMSPANVDIFDLDLFNTPASVISDLHAQGKKVICYFSAGSGENWRPDYNLFRKQDLGQGLSCWPGERWLNVRSEAVMNVMRKRIQLAAEKGCDAIDPDNMDGYSNGGGGFGIGTADSSTYLKKLSQEARKYGLATGLKNAEEIIPSVFNDVEFAVNESCQTAAECAAYDSMLAAGKPVFHIEYAEHKTNADGSVTLSSSDPELAGLSSEAIRQVYCLERNLPGRQASRQKGKFSTVIKQLDLDGWVYYCDRSQAVTETFNVGTGGPSVLPC